MQTAVSFSRRTLNGLPCRAPDLDWKAIGFPVSAVVAGYADSSAQCRHSFPAELRLGVCGLKVDIDLLPISNDAARWR